MGLPAVAWAALAPFTLSALVAACGSSGNGHDAEVPSPPAAQPDDGNKVEPNRGITVVSPVDLRVDNNRNGTIDFDDPTEDDGEDTWGTRHGAVFLANIDDDQVRCPARGTDAELAACNDAADDVVNGDDDLLDMARLKTRPFADAPASAVGTVTVSASAAAHVRFFKSTPDGFLLFDPATETLTRDELAAGVELAIEGKDIVRDLDEWDGSVEVTYTVTDGAKEPGQDVVGTDVVRLQLAPVVTPNHLDAPEEVYAARIAFDETGSKAFRDDLDVANAAASLPKTRLFQVSDQWTQDYFEPAYMSMPAPGGTVHGIHVNYRSANYTTYRGEGLRAAGKVVFSMRGKDVGAIVAYDPKHDDRMDTLNSFGNLETIPPYTDGSRSFPLGRIVRGRTDRYYPDKTFLKVVEAQRVQAPVYVSTEWLLVGHVDEFISFIAADTPRGWALMVADPLAAKTLLEETSAAGFGSTPMFQGKAWIDENSGNEVSAATTVDGVLRDTDVMAASAEAATRIESQLAILKKETGLTEAEIVRLPILFEDSYGASLAYVPGIVNGVSLGRGRFAAPDPHGPLVNGKDAFRKVMEDLLAPRQITVNWVEDWDLYHREAGEVHCGSNVRRTIPTKTGFWTSDLLVPGAR